MRDSKHLVRNLRVMERDGFLPGYEGDKVRRETVKEAADRIEALEADVIRWQAHGYAADDRSIGLEMEVERLRETLKSALTVIADWPITHPAENLDAANMAAVARATLTNQTEKGE